MYSTNFRTMRCSITILFILISTVVFCQSNLSLEARISSSNTESTSMEKRAIDGDLSSFWQSENGQKDKWLFMVLPRLTQIQKIKINMEDQHQQAIASYAIQTYINGRWENQKEENSNQEKVISISFDKAILNDRLRLIFLTDQIVKVSEIAIYGEDYVAKEATPVKEILVNQSGYNLNKPKRFTAPHASGNSPFYIQNTRTKQTEFEGIIQNHIGDFSAFNPQTNDEFVVKLASSQSYPFRIGPYWLERVSYQNMIDFMTGARHYVGTTNQIRNHSWEWRDGDFFHWSLQGLVAQFLSNPEAYQWLDKNIQYIYNNTFPNEYKGKWGALEPYLESAPDIVKLMHWDVDVKISQGLEHEHQKAELAHFLYAFPYLKEWLPQQNFDVVYAYAKQKWTKETVDKNSTSNYDRSPEHNLLALKTKLGTFKGELPPAHSVIPNLMMYEVAKKQGESDAEKYFDAAFRQMKWLIDNLDWEDPMSTKGQRMSEHLTMRAFAYFYHQYPNRHPVGLEQKIEEWAKVAIRRSDNMWDFRKFTDDGDWVPAGWNETGNVLGFPAAALAAKSAIKDKRIKEELDRLVWSHFDNAFGRNPTGRHFSFDGPKEIEGVDLGWYSTHHGGIGLLEPVRFVFDGSPKTNHYPNNPKIGNFGWTEGWVQFNVAFNTSMAYLAHSDTEIELKKTNKKTLQIRLKAPLNFDENQIDKIVLKLQHENGKHLNVKLIEEGKYSPYLSAKVRLKKKKAKFGNQKLKVTSGDTFSVSYGLGYFEKKASVKI